MFDARTSGIEADHCKFITNPERIEVAALLTLLCVTKWAQPFLSEEG
jgi:hypothetical protein